MLHWLKVLFHFSILWGIYKIGDIAVSYLHIPIPGNVFGMLLLLLLLTLKIVPISWIEDGASFLLKHMAFFFIPIAVGLMAWGELFLSQGIQLISIIMIGAVITILSTAFTTLFLSKSLDKKGYK
ncbi:holin-like protein [Desulfonispora thiosulfatigenes DSM 11270]|uniref:Holin-like protein n=1 Tax=Desulfonispora thiosulfatigenes DSM 11270 TaxID=656914 RepID=A0A1W1UJF4_DESTI|nr:CidA/LrgA family protein [Desulfonispora thiosulfatigenes]SMB80874.1 holin-like protein [Desulfonispora thiosulfatigenes DSM 11270]